VHTGQHYDANMSDAFFSDLKLPRPDFHLGIGSGTHAEQTGRVMIAYEKIAMDSRPDAIVVVGDVNSTAAVALVGTKLHIPVIHLEAGLRSHDRSMPEEINRLVTDAISDVLWTPSPDADENLRLEGVPAERIDRVGNIMIDSYEMMRDVIESQNAREEFGLEPGAFGVVTLHRPSNVDSKSTLSLLVKQLVEAANYYPLLFAVHPRTRKQLLAFDLMDTLQSRDAIILAEPQSYVRFMNLVTQSALVITDSGGVQEESTYLGIPCLTLRDTTERPITVSQGSNRLVPPERLLEHVMLVSQGKWTRGSRPELWDGRTAQRCVESLTRRISLQGVAENI